MIPNKYLKSALKQAIFITLLLGIIPFFLALGKDMCELIYDKNNQLSNFTEMMKGLLPTNQIYINSILWLSAIYIIPLFLIVILERNLKRKIMIPKWIKGFILNFEHAISAIFTVMFIASSTFLTLGFFFCFTSLGILYGLGIMLIGLILFSITTFALAMALELKDSFLVN